MTSSRLLESEARRTVGRGGAERRDVVERLFDPALCSSSIPCHVLPHQKVWKWLRWHHDCAPRRGSALGLRCPVSKISGSGRNGTGTPVTAGSEQHSYRMRNNMGHQDNARHSCCHRQQDRRSVVTIHMPSVADSSEPEHYPGGRVPETHPGCGHLDGWSLARPR